MRLAAAVRRSEAQAAGLWPPGLAAGLAKALGFLGATTTLSIGASTLAAGD